MEDFLDAVRRVAEGRTNAGIANHLIVAERTIETHIRTIFQKLGLTDNGDGHRRANPPPPARTHHTSPSLTKMRMLVVADQQFHAGRLGRIPASPLLFRSNSALLRALTFPG
ncbi:LuxR C-terminal-related transcriptional regulator [Amycolatopsis mediterranei]|uniref:LuxR C-terminal-related transcriptional regulator n=1 Tax=Amycolatopsis mediterranei TaxID=33910 RepID=UPI0002FA47E7|nr:helix-turn-helix transcriptional regulator [Amycolatopsis mediterranei]UZF73241.1 helix-turn-helix transcriptional regulator [Amycolatopsis mediterranei]